MSSSEVFAENETRTNNATVPVRHPSIIEYDELQIASLVDNCISYQMLTIADRKKILRLLRHESPKNKRALSSVANIIRQNLTLTTADGIDKCLNLLYLQMLLWPNHPSRKNNTKVIAHPLACR